MTLETSEMKDTKKIGMQTLINFHGIRATITNVNQASFKELELTHDVKSIMHYNETNYLCKLR